MSDVRASDWSEYRRLILSELERIGEDIKSINGKIEKFRQDDLSQIKTDIALLKFQAALWGGLGGIVFGTIMTFILRLLVK
jgi:hypothetical protein